MAKIVRLTESDLTRLVERVIAEQKMTAKQIGECQKYFDRIGIQFGNDGGDYSSWYPMIPGYYIEGNLTHDDYQPTLFIHKEDNLNKTIPMNPKLVTTIKGLASTMGGKFVVRKKDSYYIEFPPGKCKEYGQFSLKLLNQLKQFK